MDQVDCVVVGAGVIGLAIARSLARSGREVVLIEAAATWGSATSSRSSEVVHAGIYHPAGSLKARLCVRGRHLLSAWCADHGVPMQRCGKLIVATSEAQLPELQRLLDQSRANGLHDREALEHLTAAQARAVEPALACVGALWSPATGIIDSHALMTSLLGDAEAAGAVLALGSPLRQAERFEQHWLLRVGSLDEDVGQSPSWLRCRELVNAAGLWAPQLSRRIGPRPASAPALPGLHLCKGNYFSLAVRSPFDRLIYPVPEADGLGVHLTLDLGGQARFGPDVEWLDNIADPAEIDYQVHPGRVAGLAESIRRYWPGLPDDALRPDYAGVRPKLAGPGQPAGDFRIDGPAQHGMPGLVELFGIESPGLTASLAIAEHVADLLDAGLT
ncbi:NAD(P)/FAD-dependent oxidoreductase [Leptothrix discophora]|uniref:NAD(P)/FAD-dependent oxidoreductase n=1 Tax=Leptothrix discophora TaxID=89 RepID=A0ABT9FZ71_LEPDI|nr:NAD(P)/FAD-dependent oxidoreductase [Leptothrix discophora]MDP4299521.1 NAD(P)/FAD-dependent oxidoreductase [Leptothrix discophora]